MDTLFFENRDYFSQRINDLDSSSIQNKYIENPDIPKENPDTAVCVRIRPLTDHETKQDHIKGVLTDNYEVVNIHEPRRRVNGKPDLNSSSFTLHQVYGPEKTTTHIYQDRVQELVQWVQGGGMSMLLAYGQTGSGKTFTVTELERLVAGKLMDKESLGKWDVHISIFEVAGGNMYDLLQDRTEIKVLEDSFGTMQLLGIIEKNPTTSEEFLSLVDTAKEFRSTESTTKNSQSSRSHAICRIRVINKESPDSSEGNLVLVDLAGSEASADSQHHSRERMTETREINKSLTVLKDCIRARALWSIARGEALQKHTHIPYRSTKLTQVLKSAFDVNSTQTCKTLVIACINPSILDVAQSKNTLRYAEMLKVLMPKAKPRAFDARIPTTWANKDVREWIKKNSGAPQINSALLAPKEDGTQFCRLKEDEFVGRALLTPGVRPEKAKLLYFKLWALHIDSRSLPASSVPPREGTPTNTVSKFQDSEVINPGTFFLLNEHYREDEVKIVMVMATEPAKKNVKEELGYICAAVRSSDDVNEAYELFVADQRVIKASALGEEVVVKYDSKARYYYKKG